MSDRQWYVLDCEPEWEETVSSELSDFKVEHYLAMESRAFRMGRKGGKTIAIEVPMLPGIIFIRGEIVDLFSLKSKILHTGEIWADRHGVPVYLPEYDLQRFRSEVQAYLTVCRESIAMGCRPPAKPVKLALNLGDLKDPAVKAQVMQKMFGIVESEAA